MTKVAVTTGGAYSEIDTLASAVAYRELLEKEGKEVLTVLPGPLNQSVTKEIRGWKPDFQTKLKDKNVDFVIIDISEPKFIPDFVDRNKIVELFDHHFGYEKYWREKLGVNARIEPIGACATLIWEEYKKRWGNKISGLSANLLYTAIVSNTLNFKASVTTPRDKKAFRELKNFITLPKNWIEKYFFDQQTFTLSHVREAVINDTKTVDDLPGILTKLTIGQIELWNSRKFIEEKIFEVKEALASFGNPRWFLTSPSISEGKNYIYTESDEVKKLLKLKIGVVFKGNLGTTQNLWLRKEILKKLQE